MNSSLSNLEYVYCHGLPGSEKEIEALIPEGCLSPSIIKPLDLKGFDKLLEKSSRDGVHLIGFSLGAMTAIRTAAQRPESVKRMTLIAPAAPLELGDFLPKMAGRPVFKAAQSGDILFRAFTAIQRIGVSFAPEKVIDTMFMESPNADKDLLSIPWFKNSLKNGLKYSLGQDRRTYHKAVRNFVKPWAHFLDDVKCPVTLHHGTLDNWAPIEMSHLLKQKIATKVELITYERLGHYSTLHQAIPGVLTN